MSRAFTKESDDDLVAGDLPERPVPAHANYMTPQGHEQLQARVKALQEQHEALAVLSGEDSAAKQKLREIERDQRYFNAQLERAMVVDPAGQPRDEVHFGATVKILDEDGKTHRFTIVGDDEADVAGRQDQLGIAAGKSDDRREGRRHGQLAPPGGGRASRDRRDQLSQESVTDEW